MNYMISREGQEFGPYTLGDLQRYVASGDVALDDVARSEGMTDFLPVSQIIGTIPVPLAASSVSVTAPAVYYPDPPNLHWGLVLLFQIVTLGIFDAAWGLVLAIWMRKLDSKARSPYYYGGYLVCLIGVFFLTIVSTAGQTDLAGALALLRIGYVVLSLCARYSLRSSLEEHYNTAEPMGLALSGIMTFFFSSIYFQYHMNDIVRRKRLDAADLFSARA